MGDNLNINAGNALNIRGAQVSGEQITAEIGRNLTVESLQTPYRRSPPPYKA